MRHPPIFIITVSEIPARRRFRAAVRRKVMEDQPRVFHAIARTLGATVARDRKRVTVRTVELTHASFAAGSLPRLAKAANRDAIRTRENRIVWTFALDTGSEQQVESIGHEYLSSLAVLRRAGSESDDALHEIHLVDLHSPQLGDAPAERAPTLNQRAKPKVNILDQSAILAVLKKTLADVVLAEVRGAAYG